MPGKNLIKFYIEGGIYHIYNRGAEKRDIFVDEQDRAVFLNYLKAALLPPRDRSSAQKEFTFKGATFKGVPRLPKNFFGKIDLLAYCLMPNHFHFIVKQSSGRDIKEFMQSFCTRYSMYFNKRYKRVGSLFESRFKAVSVIDEPYLLHLTRYVHRNPLKLGHSIMTPLTSYAHYVTSSNDFVKTQFILDIFSQNQLVLPSTIRTFRDFVESVEAENKEILGDVNFDT